MSHWWMGIVAVAAGGAAGAVVGKLASMKQGGANATPFEAVGAAEGILLVGAGSLAVAAFSSEHRPAALTAAATVGALIAYGSAKQHHLLPGS